VSEYSIRRGYHIKASEAGPLAKAFIALEKKLRRPPTPEDVVRAAKDPKSPFYRAFDKAGLWDDAFAAQQARLSFARKIIESIDVTIVRGEEQVRVRGFVPIRFVDGTGDGYTATESVLNDPDRSRAYLRRLQQEAQRTTESAATWAWAIQGNAPAKRYVRAAKQFADAKIT
jgi:hypothetical protein